MTHPNGSRDDADAAAAAPLQPGRIFARRYRIVQVLGESPTATVYAAEHLDLGRWDALKVPKQSFIADAFTRYSRGAQLLAKLRHDHIAAVYDFSASDDGIAFLAMEYVRGQTLAQVLKAEGTLPVRRALTTAIQIAGALQAAHDAGVVHRRLRPSNIMLLGSGEAELVKVVDFDIAGTLGEVADSTARGELGSDNDSLEFMSPEQAMGEAMDGRGDVYSLALIVHRMLTGRSPFAGETKSELLVSRLTTAHLSLKQCAPDAAFPEALQAVLDEALQRNPGDRTTTAAAFERGLRSAFPSRLSSEQPTVARRAMPGAGPVMQPDRPAASTETLFTPERFLFPTPSPRRVTRIQYARERYRTPLAVAAMVAVFALGWGGRSLISSDFESAVETPVAVAPTGGRALARPSVDSAAVKSSIGQVASTDQVAPIDQVASKPKPLRQETPAIAQRPEPRVEALPAVDSLPSIEVPAIPAAVITAAAIPAATLPPEAPPAIPSGIHFRDLRSALADQLRAVQAVSANGGAPETSLLAMRDTAQAAWKISNTQMEKAKAAYVLASVFVHLKNREEGVKWSKLALMHCQRAVQEPTPAIVTCEPHRLLVERFDSNREVTK